MGQVNDYDNTPLVLFTFIYQNVVSVKPSSTRSYLSSSSVISNFSDTSTRALRGGDHDPLQHLRVSMPVYEGEDRRFVTVIWETKQLGTRHPSGVGLCSEISVFAVGMVECITYSNARH